MFTKGITHARAAFAAALLSLIAACDPCSAVARVHMERCNDGNTGSCEWLVDNGVDPFGRCTVAP